MMTQEINPRTGKKFYYKNSPKATKKRNIRHNPNRMWVDGNYISPEHPLHKPGRYKSFGDAAFSALQKDIKVKEGYVYAISNPAWPNWIKIGMAIDAEDRLNGYQTSSPMRDYELIHFIPSQDRSKAERVAHKAAALCGERQGEWFKITGEEAIVILEHIKESEDEGH
tara:strand:- start:47 stop:550 length:504 start_codon:yes stop_codon:yes gene_type:complete